MGAVHAHALDDGAEAGRAQRPVCLGSGQADPGVEVGEAAGRGEPQAGGHEPLESVGRARPRAGRPELHVAAPRAGLGAGAAVADREAVGAAGVAEQHRVAQRLGLGRRHLALQIQPVVEHRRQPAAGVAHGRPVGGSDAGVEPGVGRFGGLGHGLRHDRGEVAGPEPELLVEPHVLRAVGKREQPRVGDVPGREQVEGGLEQARGDAAVPAVGGDGQRAEAADAAPARGEVGADDVAVDEGGERGRRVGPPPRPHEVAVGHEAGGVGGAEERAERPLHDAGGGGQVRLSEGPHLDLRPPRPLPVRHCRSPPAAPPRRQRAGGVPAKLAVLARVGLHTPRPGHALELTPAVRGKSRRRTRRVRRAVAAAMMTLRRRFRILPVAAR